MMPSRNAHGHSSRLSIPARSIAALATTAPGQDLRRPALGDPGQGRALADLHLFHLQRGGTELVLVQHAVDELTFGIGGAVPVIRPRVRKVFEVPTALSKGGPRRSTSPPITAPISART